MKTCLRCNAPKETTEFGKETRRSDGLRPYCKECCKAMTAEYRKDEDYKNNERKYARDYNEVHKEERREYRLEYEGLPATKGIIRKTSRAWRRRSPERVLFYNAKCRAKKDGLPFSIEIADISIPEFCPVLGIKLCPGEGCVTDASPSIDQIVPNAGYVKGNFQILSHRANTIKSNATLEELKKLVAYLENLK